MGSLAGPFKTFMDSTSAKWAEQKWKDTIAAAISLRYAALHDLGWASGKLTEFCRS